MTVSARHKAIWKQLMSEGNTLRELWLMVRKLAPAEVIALVPIALNAAADGFAEPNDALSERRRRLMVAQLVLHRTIFDLMGTTRSPDADLLADVMLRFFPDGGGSDC